MERMKTYFVVSSLILACFLSITLVQGNISRKVENTLENVDMKPSSSSFITRKNEISYTYGIVGTSVQVGHWINWTYSLDITNVNFYLYYNNNNTLYSAITPDSWGMSGGVGSLNWTSSPTVHYGIYKIRIADASNSSVFANSGAIFVPGGITVSTPSTSDSWIMGSSHDIIWSSPLTIDLVGIYLTNVTRSTPGHFIMQITSGIANLNKYTWNIPTNLSTGNYKIEVQDMNNGNAIGISEWFTITQPATSSTPSTPGFPVYITLLGFAIGVLGIVAIMSRRLRLNA